MNPAVNSILQQPFVQVALPIIVALMLAAWLQNKRFDDLNSRIGELRSDMNGQIGELRTNMTGLRNEMNHRFDRIEAKLDLHNERITRLEERTALVR